MVMHNSNKTPAFKMHHIITMITAAYVNIITTIGDILLNSLTSLLIMFKSVQHYAQCYKGSKATWKETVYYFNYLVIIQRNW